MMLKTLLPLANWPVVAGLAFAIFLAYRLWGKGPNAPGPFLARFTYLWLAYRQTKGNFQVENVELHKKYGMQNVQNLPPHPRPWRRH
jgi:hypothetical protein